jgi:uncharacterized membrane protein
VLWFVVLLLTLLFTASIIAAPLGLSGSHWFGLVIYQAFSYLCHQQPERSFFIAGHPFAVCARCTGLYVGFAAAVLCYPLVRSLRRTDTPKRQWLFVAATPLFIDFSLGFLGIWENTHWSRFATGVLLGSVAVFYVMPGVIELGLGAFAAKNRHAVSELPRFSAERLASAPSDYSAPHRRI